MGKLEGKVALITGGGTGIGFATAKLFVEEGAFVYITGRRLEVLKEAVQAIGGDRIQAIQADIQKMEDIDKTYSEIKAKHEKLHILFANAGVGGFVPFENISEEAFDTVFNTNVKGVFFSIQKALPMLSEGASVVINSSAANCNGCPGLTGYAATKAAVRSLARSLTSDLRDRKIRVNAISPGPVDTPILGSPERAEAVKASVVPVVPMGRVAHPDEIAKPVLFLASDDSSFITGVDLQVDGGLNVLPGRSR